MLAKVAVLCCCCQSVAVACFTPLMKVEVVSTSCVGHGMPVCKGALVINWDSVVKQLVESGGKVASNDMEGWAVHTAIYTCREPRLCYVGCSSKHNMTKQVVVHNLWLNMHYLTSTYKHCMCVTCACFSGCADQALHVYLHSRLGP